MTSRPTPLFVAGRPVSAGSTLDITNPWDGAVVGQTWQADAETYDAAADACVAAAPLMAAMPVHARAAILQRVSAGLGSARETFARRITEEAGKPIRDARTEVDRARMTFQVAAEEARRLAGGGDVLPMDLAPHGEGRVAMTRRVPLGPIAAISPFNFPLNLVAHKLAPAVAAGNPVVLKPASRTPLSALALAELMRECGLPDGALSVLPMDRTVGDRLVGDDRFRMLTFTGSSDVGWAMKARAGRKKVVLELGGNAGVIVDASGDAAEAARRVATGGFAFAGQSCISVQRVYVHASVWTMFIDTLLPEVAALRVGNPMDDATAVGPLITPDDVERVATWVREATDAGAKVLAGGSPLGARLFAPTVLTHVPRSTRVCTDEVFGPVVIVEQVASFDEAIQAVNDSTFGLQAGVFTSDLDHAFTAFDRLEVGGILINDVPTFRIDHMPYGGVKDSGLGREGPHYTIEEMSELRLLIIRR